MILVLICLQALLLRNTLRQEASRTRGGHGARDQYPHCGSDPVIGIIGFVVSLMFWSSWGGFGGARDGDNHTTVVER